MAGALEFLTEPPQRGLLRLAEAHGMIGQTHDAALDQHAAGFDQRPGDHVERFGVEAQTAAQRITRHPQAQRLGGVKIRQNARGFVGQPRPRLSVHHPAGVIQWAELSRRQRAIYLV